MMLTVNSADLESLGDAFYAECWELWGSEHLTLWLDSIRPNSQRASEQISSADDKESTFVLLHHESKAAIAVLCVPPTVLASW